MTDWASRLKTSTAGGGGAGGGDWASKMGAGGTTPNTAQLRQVSGQVDPTSGIEWLRTNEGDTIPVRRAKGKVVAGYYEGSPMIGEQTFPAYGGQRREAVGEPPIARIAPNPDREPAAPTGGFVDTLESESLRTRFGAKAVSALTNDPAVRKERFATLRGIAPEQLRTAGDEVLVQGKDGVWYSETPRTPASSMSKAGATLVGDAPVLIPEGVAAVMSHGNPMAVGGAGAAGEVVRRGIARQFGERQDAVQDYVVRPAITGAVSTATTIGGNIGGAVLTKGANRVLRKGAGTGITGKIVGDSDIATFMSKEGATARDVVRARAANMERFGVRGTTGMVTGNDQLIAAERQMTELTGPAGMTMRVAHQQVKGDVRSAVVEGRGGLPAMDTTNGSDSGAALVGSAQSLMAKTERKRTSQSKRMYKRVFEEYDRAGKPDIGIDEVLNGNPTTGFKGLRQRIEEAATPEERAELMKWGESLAPGAFEPKIGVMYSTKEQLQGEVKALLKSKKNPDLAYALGDVVDQITGDIAGVLDGKALTPDAARQMLEEAALATQNPEEEAMVAKFIDQLAPGSFKNRGKSMSDLSRLHGLQQSMRERATALQRGGDELLGGQIHEIRNKVLDSIETAAPSYKPAREAYKYASRSYESLEGNFANKKWKDSLLNSISKTGNDWKNTAPNKLFGEGMDPKTVARVKSEFISEGAVRRSDGKIVYGEGVQKWAAIKRGAMTDVLETLPDTLELSAKKMELMKAALEPQEFEALSAFMGALKDVRRGLSTAANASDAAGRQMVEEKLGGWGPKILRRATTSPFIQSRDWQKAKLSKMAPKIAEELSGPGVEKFLRLRQIQPGTKQQVQAVLNILGAEWGYRNTAKVMDDGGQ